jgi:hypothetical protein
MKRAVHVAFATIIWTYSVGAVALIPYFNRQYASDHGVRSWLTFGELVATSRAAAWPYFVFFDKNRPFKPHDHIPSSVAWFVVANDRLKDVEAIRQGFDAAQSPDDAIESTKRFLREGLAAAKKVDRQELNRIYPGWGDRFVGDWIPTTHSLLEAFEERRRDQLVLAQARLLQWNEWATANGRALVQTLRDRFGIQFRSKRTEGQAPRVRPVHRRSTATRGGRRKGPQERRQRDESSCICRLKGSSHRDGRQQPET